MDDPHGKSFDMVLVPHNLLRSCLGLSDTRRRESFGSIPRRLGLGHWSKYTRRIVYPKKDQHSTSEEMNCGGRTESHRFSVMPSDPRTWSQRIGHEAF